MLLQLFQLFFASMIGYSIWGEKVLILANKYETAFMLIIYVGGVLSFPLATYLLYETKNYFQSKNMGLTKALIFSTILGIILMIRYIFPAGADIVAFMFITLLISIVLDLFGYKTTPNNA